MSIDRELLITLCFAGGSPETAFLTNNKYTLQEYIDALQTNEYKVFSEEVNKNFIENTDLRLVGQLYKIEKALSELSSSDKNYPALIKNYLEILKITAPIVERLSKHAQEINTFEGLKLVINGAEGKPEVDS